MISRAQIGALRNTSVRTNGDLRQVINPRVFADPTVVSNLEIPRELHSNARLDVNAFTQTGPEKPEQPAAKRRRSDHARSQ